jgi:hypothetical protein
MVIWGDGASVTRAMILGASVAKDNENPATPSLSRRRQFAFILTITRF